MHEIVRSLDEITTEAISIYNRMEKDYRRWGELMIEAKAIVPHGQWLPYLEKNFPFLGKRQANRYMELARDETKTLASVTSRGVVVRNETHESHLKVSQEQPKSEALTAQQFRRGVTELKKQNEALFQNRGKFILNRINDALTNDDPGKGLPELEKINPSELLPADLDLVFNIIEACEALASRAANWHSKLRSKFNG